MVEPLEYNLGLSLQEAEEKYKEAKAEFERIKSDYSGLLSRLRKSIKPEDNKTLSNCIGVVLPLCLEGSVQEQFREYAAKQRDVEGTLLVRLNNLNIQILDYLANFKNSGVTRLEGKFLPDFAE